MVVSGLQAADNGAEGRKVLAVVSSCEDYVASRRFVENGIDAPYGWHKTVVATIVAPESLAGREIALPYDTRDAAKDPLCQKGALVSFEHRMNLADLRNRTRWVGRSPVEFPYLGLSVIAIGGRPVIPVLVYRGIGSPEAVASVTR